MVDQGICWCFRPSVIILTISKCMRIDENRLFLVRVVMLRVCRHGAQVAAGGRIDVRFFLDLAHQTAVRILCGLMSQCSTHGLKIVKTGRQTARTRAEQRCATGNDARDRSDQNEGRPPRLEEDAQEESVSEQLIVRSSDGD